MRALVCESWRDFDELELRDDVPPPPLRPGGVRLRLGVALQEAALDPMQTGTEILRLQGRLYGTWSGRQSKARAAPSETYKQSCYSIW